MTYRSKNLIFIAKQVALYWVLLVLVPPLASAALLLATPFVLAGLAWCWAWCWIEDRRNAAKAGGLPC